MAASALSNQYDRYVDTGEIRDDRAQRDVLAALQALKDRLENPAKPMAGWRRLFNKAPQASPLKGLYVWGGVGRGKSMLMDLFFNGVQVQRKRRVHFHAFMQEVHARIHQLRQGSELRKGTGDPVAVLAREIAAETSLLCFDELQATDVADATLLYRLFYGLFEAGMVIVSTSNHPPASLYTGGVQKERFVKFISLLESHMQVISLTSQHDYRRLQTAGLRQSYYYPLDGKADQFIYDTLAKMGVNTNSTKANITIQGRRLEFRLYDGLIGRFRFNDLCEAALGPADYLAIADKLDMLILTNIPKLPAEKRNEAKRFVTLIDALYEHKVKLLATAEVPPEQIYSEGDGAFEFKRTVSRLMEMQSARWMKND